MRLFGYYAFHSFKNQLRKIFKTWVLVFLIVCMVMGGIIGVIAGTVASRVSENAQNAEEITDLQEPDAAGSQDEEPAEDAPQEGVQEPAGPAKYLADNGLSVVQAAEAVTGVAVILILAFMIAGADKSGSRIFLPADVKLLFPSPMKPQSVLLFRLGTQMGVAIFIALYQLFQLPNLMRLGLGLWPTLSLIVCFGLTIMTGMLLQTLLYTLASTHPRLKKNLRYYLYAALAVLLACYFLYAKSSGQGYIPAAIRMFSAPAGRWIPFWGWIKGVFGFAAEGRTALSIACILFNLIGTAVLFRIIGSLKADFYEEATQRSEEVAALLEKAQDPNAGLVVRQRKKDRSEKLKRDGFTRGNGANVYFFKAMYNRARFAHFGAFTKTSETYILVCVAVALLCRFAIQTTILIPVVLAAGVIAFYRTLGNPLEEDTKTDYFVLIPESNLAKLWFSLMGGTVNCLLDMLPGLIASCIILGANPLPLLGWIPFILSVDLFGTAAGTFINLSVPVNAGKTLKQIVQVMFLYFGLLPDIAIIAIGFAFGNILLAAVLCTAFNVLAGLILLAFSTIFLQAR